MPFTVRHRNCWCKPPENRSKLCRWRGASNAGQTPEADQALADELLNSTKDRYEQQVVTDRIKDRLEPLTTSLDIAETGIMQLSNIQHLYTPIEGTLKSEDGVLSVLEQTASDPRTRWRSTRRGVAVSWARSRRYRAAGMVRPSVGLITSSMGNSAWQFARRSRKDGECGCMRVRASLQASQPDKEWDETALKFRPMLKCAVGMMSAKCAMSGDGALSLCSLCLHDDQSKHTNIILKNHRG